MIFVNFFSTTYYFLKCPQKISPQLQLLKQVKFDLFWKVLPSLRCALVHCVVLALTLCYSVWAWSYSAEKILVTEVGFSAICVRRPGPQRTIGAQVISFRIKTDFQNWSTLLYFEPGLPYWSILVASLVIMRFGLSGLVCGSFAGVPAPASL